MPPPEPQLGAALCARRPNSCAWATAPPRGLVSPSTKRLRTASQPDTLAFAWERRRDPNGGIIAKTTGGSEVTRLKDATSTAPTCRHTCASAPRPSGRQQHSRKPIRSGTTRPPAKQLNTPFLPDLIRAITGAVLLPARPPRSGRPPPLKPSRRHHTLRHWHKGRNRSTARVPAFPQRQREQHLCYLLAESASFSSVPNKTSRKKRVFVRAANASQLAGKETHPAVMSRRRF